MNGYSPFSYQIFPPEYFEKKAVRKTALFTGILIVLYVLSSLFVSGFTQGFFTVFELSVNTTAQKETIEQISFIVTYVITMALPFFVFMLLTKIPVKTAFPLRKPRPSLALPAIPLTLGMSVIGFLISSILLSLFMNFGLSYNVPPVAAPTTTFATVLYLLSMSVLPAIIEELAFRGILMQSLRRHGDMFALVVSSVVFSLFHGNLLQFPNTFVLGMLIGFFVLRTDSLVTGMLMHFFNNFLITVFDMYVVAQLSEAEGNFATLALLGTYILIGVIAFVYLIVKKKEIFKLFPSYTYLSTPKKLGAFFTQPLFLVGVGIMVFISLGFFAL